MTDGRTWAVGGVSRLGSLLVWRTHDNNAWQEQASRRRGLFHYNPGRRLPHPSPQHDKNSSGACGAWRSCSYATPGCRSCTVVVTLMTMNVASLLVDKLRTSKSSSAAAHTSVGSTRNWGGVSLHLSQQRPLTALRHTGEALISVSWS